MPTLTRRARPRLALPPMPAGRRLLLAALVLVAMGFYLVNALHFATNPLRIEEGDWPPMARAIVHHGKPVIPYTEDPRIHFNADGSVDTAPMIGAWHPPLYQYVLAAAMTVIGTNAGESLRIVGIVALLAACLLMVLIARETERERWPFVGAGGVILLLLHPYTSQGSTFVDVDTGIYAPGALLVFWLAIRFAKRPERLGWRPVLALAGALALVAWMKLTTTAMLVPVLVLWWLLARGPRRLWEVVAAVLAGAAIFFSTYALWCAATGIPFSYTFDITFAQKSGRLFDGTAVDQAELWHITWLLPALLLLVGAYAIDAVWSFARTRRARPMDLLWGFGVAILIGYVYLTPTSGWYQGKYAFPGFVALMLPIAWMALRRARPVSYIAVAWAVAVGVVAAMLLPDFITSLAYTGMARTERQLWFAITALALVVAWRVVPSRVASAPLGALIVAGAIFAGQSLDGLRNDTSPMYPVKDTAAFEAATRTINDVSQPGDIAFVSKDMTHYVLRARVLDGHDAIFRGDEATARIVERDPHVRILAYDTFGPPSGPATQAVLQRCFQIARQFGQASVFLRLPGSCAARK